MIPQIRDAALTEDDLYSVLHNFDAKQLYNFQHVGMVRMIGCFVGIFLSGIAVTLGVTSVLLFISKRDQGLSRRDYFICAYTILLLFVLLAFEIQAFVFFNAPTIFFLEPRSREAEYSTTLGRISLMTLAVLGALADGLLVLRCFLVQRAFGSGSSSWANLFWGFPACVWAITVVLGTLGAIGPASTPTSVGILALTFNIVLNVYATLFITTRLFLHRRMVIAYLGDKALATQHVHIISILLESAAMNIPFVVIAVIFIESGSAGEVFSYPIGAASQVLAATLIIYRTALGRVFSQHKGAEIRRLVETREASTSGNVELTPKPEGQTSLWAADS